MAAFLRRADSLTGRAFLRRLSAAFGWRYVAACILAYGVNQGMGEKFVFGARQYYLLDDIGMTSAEYGRVAGFSHIPWQLKSLFGLLSDTVPLGGLHRAPYMLIAGVLGLFALGMLTALPAATVSAPLAGFLLLLTNVNFAMPDVMIDATVAERAKVRPELGAALQALCWGSLGVAGVPAGVVKGYLIEWYGARLLFGLAIFAALAVMVPPLGGWLGETRRAAASRKGVRAMCGEVWSHPTKKVVAASAALVGLYSISLGVLQLTVGRSHSELVDSLTLGGNFGLTTLLYLLLRRVDDCLARAAVFTFLSGVLQPYSSVLFEWAHAPAADSADLRCRSAAACAALDAAVANGTAPPPPDGSLPCGWAAAQQLPCLSPIVYTWVGVVSSATLAGGTALYATYFQTWSYRSILATSQAALFLLNLLDNVFVARLNLRFGVSDVAFIFGDEVLVGVLSRLQAMPFLIYAAKLCPPSVEASMFALFMGLSNFGSAAGQYVGSALLRFFGGVEAPAFERLGAYVFTRTLIGATPILLVPLLVPRGTPQSTAAAMGARISGDVELDKLKGGEDRQRLNSSEARPAAEASSEGDCERVERTV